MKRILHAFVIFTGTLMSFMNSAQAQSFQLDVRHQEYSGDTMFFDIYMSRVGGSSDYHLGNADFVLSFNSTNFSSPSTDFVASSDSLFASNGSTSAYSSNIVSSISSGNIIINLQQPTFSNQTDFNNNIAVISTSATKLGTFWVNGLTDATQSPTLTWVTNGNPKTLVYTLNASSPWKSNKIPNGSMIFNDPTPTTAPGTQLTALNVSSKTDTSMTLAWTSGSGDYTLILAKQGSAVSTDLPADGIQYSAGDFASGSEIKSTGVYVVYNGPSSTASTTIQGLTANTVYYFSALTYSGSEGYSENYRVDSVATVSDTTNATEPNTSATALQFTAFSTTSLSLSWTNGDGANRIVVAKEGSAVDVDPSDANAYTANADFTAGANLGSGNIVVYDGSGSSLTVTNLNPDSNYYFAVYEYNGSYGTRNYRVDTPATGHRYTLASEPTAIASNASFSNVTTTSMTFSFNGGNGAKRLILIKSASAVDSIPRDGEEFTANTVYGSGDVFQTGNYVIYASDSNNVTVTGLSSGTVYHYSVIEYNGTGEAANYLTSTTLTASQTTLSDEPTAASTNFAFTAWDTTELSFNWISSGAGTGSNRIVVAREASAVDFVPTDQNSYTANSTFGSGTGLGTSSDNYVIYNGTDTTASVSGLSIGTLYYFAVYEYNGSSGSENYYSTPLTGNRYTDTASPSSPAASASFSNITTSSMQFDFTSGNGGRRLILVRPGSAVNGSPSDGYAYNASSTLASGDTIGTDNYVVYDGTGTSVTVSGLTANTTYYFEVFEYNQANSNSESNNYLPTPSLTASHITLQSAPVNQVSGLTVTSRTTSTIDLSWTSAGSDSVLIVATSVDSVANSELPVSGTIYQYDSNYAAGFAALGNGYVVYKGTGTTATVRNLGQDTMWHFAAFAYAGGNGSQAYNTSFEDNTDSANTKFQLDITVMLEGPMIYQTMDTSLNVSGYVPTSQPYAMAPYYYGGTETATLNDSVVDWVLVEVRKSATVGAADSSTRVTRMAALLLFNGSVVATDGHSPLTIDIDSALYGNTFVVVYHRNHIPVLTATQATLAAGGYSFDFTSGTSQANGTSAMTTVNGVAAMWGGNAHPSSNSIGANDRNAGWDDRNSSGYKSSDVNLDGYVDAADRSLIYNNTGQDRQINN
ncbi:MAG: hypothetical protein GC180_11975 [Bacteroidetes bacterium]|nr:hypothetical protein [Bacteroidota bacterium]